MKIILDAMGGDNAPLSTVKGAILAKKEFGVDIILVGDKQKIEDILNAENASGFEIIDTKTVITMEDEATSILREKRDSSMGVSFDMLAKGEDLALVSAGNTGAILSGATLIAKRLKGVRRAGLGALLPTKSGGTLLMDCGANIECTDEALTQFALMGSIYFAKTRKVSKPRVALVNNGAEATKGTEIYQKTHVNLQKLGEMNILNFTGNIEGRDIAIGSADVIVADGFTGNILLKTYEGVALHIASEVKKIFTKNIFTKISSLFVSSGINDFKNSMDYKEVGGAPLLGVKKPVIKAHGSSNDYTIRSAIKQAIDYASSGVIDEIEQKLFEINEKIN